MRPSRAAQTSTPSSRSPAPRGSRVSSAPRPNTSRRKSSQRPVNRLSTRATVGLCRGPCSPHSTCITPCSVHIPQRARIEGRRARLAFGCTRPRGRSPGRPSGRFPQLSATPSAGRPQTLLNRPTQWSRSRSSRSLQRGGSDSQLRLLARDRQLAAAAGGALLLRMEAALSRDSRVSSIWGAGWPTGTMLARLRKRLRGVLATRAVGG